MAARRGETAIAEAINLTATLVSIREIDPGNFIFSNGNPGRMELLGTQGLRNAAMEQIAIERKSIGTIMERNIQQRIKRIQRRAR